MRFWWEALPQSDLQFSILKYAKILTCIYLGNIIYHKKVLFDCWNLKLFSILYLISKVDRPTLLVYLGKHVIFNKRKNYWSVILDPETIKEGKEFLVMRHGSQQVSSSMGINNSNQIAMMVTSNSHWEKHHA